MPAARRTLLLALALAAAVAAPRTVRAQGTAGAQVHLDGTTRAALIAERQRLRGDLDRANADVDALKRANRSLRDDYRLRARLADAEALARRLTELDARLGTPAATRAGGEPEPRGLPSDGPAELEAKADILSDQARRLASRGDALLVRAHDLKARQNLRRRVGQMERDPFSPLEGSKRRSMAAGTTGALAGGKPGPTLAGSPEKGSGGTTAGTVVDQGVSGSPPPAFGPAPAREAPGAQGTTSTSVPSPGSIVNAPKTSPTPTTPTGLSDTGALSVQLRDSLDPATLAELQRMEATSGTVTGVDALERAGAALKARAERLEREAATLRAGRPPTPRAR